MLTACDRFDNLAHLYDREDVLVQTWHGEPATRLRARIRPVNAYAAHNMSSCTGRSCNGRSGVREKAHHLHCCRPSLVRKPWPPVLDRGCWRARAPFERHRTSRAYVPARALLRLQDIESVCRHYFRVLSRRCAAPGPLSTWVVKHGNFSHEYRVLGLRSPRMVHADLTLKL